MEEECQAYFKGGLMYACLTLHIQECLLLFTYSCESMNRYLGSIESLAILGGEGGFGGCELLSSESDYLSHTHAQTVK